MRYFIFTILLIVPLLLTAQSKKEQIATLNLRVDSLFEVLLNNAQKLSDQRGEIFQLSQEKESLEKDISECVDSKNNTLNALVESNSSLEGLKEQHQLAKDELQKLRKDLITAIRPGDNHSYMIGMFDGLEMIMGCEKEFTFRICDNCLQEYLNEQELEIIKKNIAWKDSNNWINTLEINSQFSYDIQFDDESGEHIEGGVYMGDGCCPVGDETVLEFLNLKKGDICRVDYTYENAIIGVDTESRTQWAWAITEIIKLSDEEINLYFIMEGEEEDYSDW